MGAVGGAGGGEAAGGEVEAAEHRSDEPEEASDTSAQAEGTA